MVVTVPTGLQSYNERLDLRSTLNAFVDVEAKLDRPNRTVTWTLRTIDPTTGELAMGVDAGFLPPNQQNGEGEGFVRYTVEPKVGLKTGDQIDAQASIVFDSNPAIQTPVALNTIDSGTPTSEIHLTAPRKAKAAPQTKDLALKLTFSGTDDGSGIADYDGYVSVDGQPFEQWVDDSVERSVIYRAAPGHTYRFASRSRDQVGHLEPIPTELGNDMIKVGTNRKNKLVGGAGQDGLIGLGKADTLIGKAGDDILNGGKGNDKLYGRAGQDTLIGGKGYDIFALQKEPKRDLILDFKDGQDRLGLSHGVSFDQLDVFQKGRNTLINLGSDQLALLQTVKAHQITTSDFVRT